MGAYDTLILAEPTLVNYWKLDDPSGTSCVDSKGSFNLTYAGGFTLAQAGPGTGQGSSVAFNGTTGKASGSPGASSFVPYSVEAWIKTASSTFTGAIFNTRWSTSTGNACEVRCTNPSKITGFVGDGGTTWDGFPEATLTYANGIWHHVVMTVSTTQAILYFDGVAVNTASYSTATPQLKVIGQSTEIGAFSLGSEWYNGNLAKMALYSSVLSAPTVLVHYNAMFGGANPAALLPAM